jgi:hypothetical protein
MADNKNDKPAETQDNFLTRQEQAICQQVAAVKTLQGQYALALLALNEGGSQEEAAEKAGLSSEQMSDLQSKFQKNRLLDIFPDLLPYESKQKPKVADGSDLIIQNQTDKHIGISFSNEDRLIFSPYGTRIVPGQEKTRLQYAPWEKKNLITVQKKAEEEQEETIYLAIGCLVWIFILGIPLGFLVPAWRGNLVYWGIFAGISLLVVAYALFKNKLSTIGTWIVNLFSMIAIFGVSIGLPALVITYFGGGNELLAAANVGQFSLGLLGRALQLTLISVATILPALLYFLFDRQKIGTLRESFYRNIVSLVPHVETILDAKALFGGRIEELYGPEKGAGGGMRYFQGTQWPIVVTTLIVSLGWMLALAPFGPLPDDFQAADLHKLFLPQMTAINFGFLGAYFFGINLILRRYVRADLKPKAYSHISVRFLSVLVLVWAISVLPEFGTDTSLSTAPILLLFAFFVGIIPETATTAIQEFLRARKWLEKIIPQLGEKLPLNIIEGINLYDRARLLEEGIENIENLAHNDLIDLMLQTRIPLPRLVDWVDQSILYLHAKDSLVTESEDGEKQSADDLKALSQMLRAFGIRTATDLERTKDYLIKALGEDTPEADRLQVIYESLKDDEWLSHIRYWRDQDRKKDLIYDLDDFYQPREVSASLA